MKPIPPPPIQGKTDAGRFDTALRKILTDPKKNGAQPAANGHSAPPKLAK